jgi:uncharacterized DUF497 family protein
MLKFEWDTEKNGSNQSKHRVSFEAAVTVFGDPLACTFRDPDHSVGEKRLLTFDLSQRGRLLVVSHTERRNVIRIISARKATRYERGIDEEDQ